ncbi:hypothetical protein X777_06134, partial [Ooceraea biroi]
GRHYTDFLRQRLPELLEEIPLLQRRNMFFQQDGAPPHAYRDVTTFINERFPGRWIAQHGPIIWPARFADLTPLDFFSLGSLKTKCICKNPLLLMTQAGNVTINVLTQRFDLYFRSSSGVVTILNITESFSKYK